LRPTLSYNRLIGVIICFSGGCSGGPSARSAASPDGAAGVDVRAGDFGLDASDREHGRDLAGEAAPDALDGSPSGKPDGAPAEGADDIRPAGSRTAGEIYCPSVAAPYPSPLPTERAPTVVPIMPPGGISFLEGPVWIADRGVLLFSEWNAGHRILQLTPPQAIEELLPASGSNGLAITPDGSALLMVTLVEAKTLSRLSLVDKRVQILAQDFNGQPFAQPNDLTVRADGTIYFTDYQAGRLYERAVDGTLTVIASLPLANGVGLSPDEKTLYLNADTRTVKYPLSASGAVGAGSDFATGLKGADGLAIDCAGNVYIAQNMGGSLVVVSAGGAKLGEIGGLPQTVTNAAFGGADRRTLYITTASALYAVTLAVPGLPY
jgi:gluconolactonase